MTALDSLVLWVRGYVQRLAEFARLMTKPERVLSGVLLASLAVGPSLSWVATGLLFLVAMLFLPVLVDAMLVRSEAMRLQVDLIEAKRVALTVNLAKPTGAPRVAEVACSHGAMQRLVYGPDGWAHAGPAPDTRHEEARTS